METIDLVGDDGEFEVWGIFWGLVPIFMWLIVLFRVDNKETVVWKECGMGRGYTDRHNGYQWVPTAITPLVA